MENFFSWIFVFFYAAMLNVVLFKLGEDRSTLVWRETPESLLRQRRPWNRYFLIGIPLILAAKYLFSDYINHVLSIIFSVILVIHFYQLMKNSILFYEEQKLYYNNSEYKTFLDLKKSFLIHYTSRIFISIFMLIIFNPPFFSLSISNFFHFINMIRSFIGFKFF